VILHDIVLKSLFLAIKTQVSPFNLYSINQKF